MRFSIHSTITAAILLLASCTHRPDVTASYDIIPSPLEVSLIPEGGDFRLTSKTVISYPADDPTLLTDATHLQGYIEKLTGLKIKVTDEAVDKDVIILKADLESENPEGYILTVGPDKIEINGTTAAGTFYGIQTLRKSIPAEGLCNVVFPAVTISDEPRFGYRGAHFDVCRHFFPADSVKSFIDMLALHNINTFHWHLSDDQGWRIEIKSHPELTAIGSHRDGTVVGHGTAEFDTIPVEGYFTQDEIKDIIKYAADRHIDIIPEIDLPGHMQAALSAYPELGCTGGPYEVWKQWGVSEDVLCAGNDSTYAFIEDVLGEVADLFPSPYFHIGGDECPKVNWEECAKCQAKIVELGLKSDKESSKEEKLQSYVMKRAADFLATKGKRPIGWDEILEGGATPETVIMSWRGESGGTAAAKNGNDVIMSPNTYFYFDYYQTLDQDNEPDAIGGYIPLEKVYSYEPITDAYTPEEAEHIIGVQANLWTEYIPTFFQALYMELPRMAALSEVQWTQGKEKDYDAFLKRLPQLLAHYELEGYPYSTRAYDIIPAVEVNDSLHTVIFTLSAPEDAPIYYTLDGSTPDNKSNQYTEPVEIAGDAVLKAVASYPFGYTKTYADSVQFNKATGKKITLANNAVPKYSGHGPGTLVDGIFGGERYSSGSWLGFNGKDLDATIDLDGEEDVSSVAVRTCVSTGGWVFDARSMTVWVSADGLEWREVAHQEYPAMEGNSAGVFDHTLDFATVNTRFVRVNVESEKVIPQWHSAKGKNAFLFVDEIVVK